MFEEDVLVVLKALFVDLQVVEEVDELPSIGVQVSEGVYEYYLVAGHRNAVLYVSGELLVSDHEDNDFEPLGGEVDEVEDGLVLQLLEAPHLHDDEALALAHSPNRQFFSQLGLEGPRLEPEVVVLQKLALEVFYLVGEVLQ